MLKIAIQLCVLLSFAFCISGCNTWELEKESYANLIVDKVSYTENDYYISCSLPDGAYMPDNPDFEFGDCDTYTGNMAQYVKHHHGYEITYLIINTGDGMAYDTEIDLYYSCLNGDTEVHTIFLGDVDPNKSISKAIQIYSTDKVLKEVNAEAFWFDWVE